MRILAVNTMDRSGGAEKIASDLVSHFRQAGHSSTLAVGRKRGGIADILIPQERNYRPQNQFAPAPADKEKRDWEYSQGIEDFNFPGTWDLLSLGSKGLDLLHLHNLHGGYFDLRALPWLSNQLPTIITLHDAWLTSGHCAHSLGCRRWLSGCGDCPDLEIYPSIPVDGTAFNWKRKNEIVSNSNLHIVTPSKWLMDKLKSSVLWPHFLSTKVIPNGVDTTVYLPGSKQEARNQLGLPNNSVILLSVLNVIKNNPFKDFDANLRVINWLSKRYLDKPIFWICLGSKGPTTEIGNATGVFVPYQDNEKVLATFYRAADIFLHLARADTFPTVNLEALSCGCPVASTTVGGIPEQVNSILPLPDKNQTASNEDSATGILVKPGDDKELVNQLSFLLSSPDLIQTLGKNASEDAKRRFNINLTVKNYLDWFAKILNTQSRSNDMQIKGATTLGLANSRNTLATPKNPPFILMYHRITDIYSDPQLLTVKPNTFEAQLQLIKKDAEPISLNEMINELHLGRVPWNTVALTFDDGYADNFFEALPLLKTKNIPATVFCVSTTINSKDELWWDFLEQIFLVPGKLPRLSKIEIGDISVEINLGDYGTYSENDALNYAHWSVLDQNDPTPRHVFYRKFYSIIQSIQEPEIRSKILTTLANLVEPNLLTRDSHRTLTSKELIELSNEKLIDVGSHTVNHPILSKLSFENQVDEILVGRNELQKIIDKPVNLFAYPYGYQNSYTDKTIRILEENNFKGAVTTSERAVLLDSNIFQLPRLTIRECSTDKFLKKLAHHANNYTSDWSGND